MSNSLASPRQRSDETLELVPVYSNEDRTDTRLDGAAEAAKMALADWDRHPERTSTATNGQRVAMAPSAKAGDTSIEAVSITFGAHVPDPGDMTALKEFSDFSQALTRPMFFPRVVSAQARTARSRSCRAAEIQRPLLERYLRAPGLRCCENKGEVFVDVPVPKTSTWPLSTSPSRATAAEASYAQPAAERISRALGPTAGDVKDVLLGKVGPAGSFRPAGSATCRCRCCSAVSR